MKTLAALNLFSLTEWNSVLVFGRDRDNFIHSGYCGAGFVLETVLT